MPWVSEQQRKWGHSASGLQALGGASKVKEWDSATMPGSLPDKVGNSTMKHGTLFGKPRGEVIKHSGKLTAEAHSSGRSKIEQAEHDSHSSNPHTRARGALGIRLVKKTL